MPYNPLFKLLVCKKHGDTVLYHEGRDEAYCPFCKEEDNELEPDPNRVTTSLIENLKNYLNIE